MKTGFVSSAIALALLLQAGCSSSVAPDSPSSKSTRGESGSHSRDHESKNSSVGAASTSGSSQVPGWPEQFALPEEKQNYLRDVELLVLTLNQDVLSVIKNAVLDGRTDAVWGFLAPNFEAHVFSETEARIQQGPVTVRLWDEDNDERIRLDGQEFVQQLVDYGQSFAELKQVLFHVTALRPEEYGNFSGRWIAGWDMHLLGRLKNNHLAERVYQCELQFARFSDGVASTEGWIDRYDVTNCSHVESTDRLMEEITETTEIDVASLSDNWKKAGPPYPEFTGGANLIDFDRDGRLDLIITGESRPILYRNLGNGRFEDATRSAGLSIAILRDQRVAGALVADFDNDHFEDIVFAIEYKHKDQDSFQRKLHFGVYKNLGDGSFRGLALGEHNLHEFWLPPSFIGVSVADYDRDGLIDLYVAKSGTQPPPERQRRWVSDRGSPEGVLLKNEGDWNFRNATAEAEMTGATVDTNTALWVDAEPDGDPDLFLANHMGPNLLWENTGNGKFVKRRFDEGFGGFSMGATAGDMDEDGDIDFYVANMYSAAGSRVMGNLRAQDYPPGMFEMIRGFITGNELIENRGTTNFVPVGVAANVANAGWSYGPSFVDLNGDGWLDIYSPAGYQSVTRGKPDT